MTGDDGARHAPRIELDVHLGGQRPSGYGYWPLPEDDPGVEVARESVRLVTPDGALVRGLLWLPPGGRPWKTAVILSHPRATSACITPVRCWRPRGAVLGFGTRYMGNDIDCLHEACIIDVRTAHDGPPGAEAVVLLGNSGGGSLMAMAQAELGIGDGWIGMAAHPGEGVFMLQVIDPSVADEHDPLSRIPELDMYDPDNGWRPWPQPCSYDPAWLALPGGAGARVARIDAVAKAALADSGDARQRLKAVDPESDLRAWRDLRARTVAMRYLTIYRTLADPAYLDLSIDPDERPMGSLFAAPDPLDANYGRRSGPHDDGEGMAVHLVRPVQCGQAGRHHAARQGAHAPRPPHRRHRDPGPPGRGDRGQRRRRGRDVRRDEGRPTTSRATAPRPWPTSPTGWRPGSRSYTANVDHGLHVTQRVEDGARAARDHVVGDARASSAVPDAVSIWTISSGTSFDAASTCSWVAGQVSTLRRRRAATGGRPTPS